MGNMLPNFAQIIFRARHFASIVTRLWTITKDSLLSLPTAYNVVSEGLQVSSRLIYYVGYLLLIVPYFGKFLHALVSTLFSNRWTLVGISVVLASVNVVMIVEEDPFMKGMDTAWATLRDGTGPVWRVMDDVFNWFRDFSNLWNLFIADFSDWVIDVVIKLGDWVFDLIQFLVRLPVNWYFDHGTCLIATQDDCSDMPDPGGMPQCSINELLCFVKRLLFIVRTDFVEQFLDILFGPAHDVTTFITDGIDLLIDAVDAILDLIDIIFAGFLSTPDVCDVPRPMFHKCMSAPGDNCPFFKIVRVLFDFIQWVIDFWDIIWGTVVRLILGAPVWNAFWSNIVNLVANLTDVLAMLFDMMSGTDEDTGDPNSVCPGNTIDDCFAAKNCEPVKCCRSTQERMLCLVFAWLGWILDLFYDIFWILMNWIVEPLIYGFKVVIVWFIQSFNTIGKFFCELVNSTLNLLYDAVNALVWSVNCLFVYYNCGVGGPVCCPGSPGGGCDSCPGVFNWVAALLNNVYIFWENPSNENECGGPHGCNDGYIGTLCGCNTGGVPFTQNCFCAWPDIIQCGLKFCLRVDLIGNVPYAAAATMGSWTKNLLIPCGQIGCPDGWDCVSICNDIAVPAGPCPTGTDKIRYLPIRPKSAIFQPNAFKLSPSGTTLPLAPTNTTGMLPNSFVNDFFNAIMDPTSPLIPDECRIDSNQNGTFYGNNSNQFFDCLLDYALALQDGLTYVIPSATSPHKQCRDIMTHPASVLVNGTESEKALWQRCVVISYLSGWTSNVSASILPLKQDWLFAIDYYFPSLYNSILSFGEYFSTKVVPKVAFDDQCLPHALIGLPTLNNQTLFFTEGINLSPTRKTELFKPSDYLFDAEFIKAEISKPATNYLIPLLKKPTHNATIAPLKFLVDPNPALRPQLVTDPGKEFRQQVGHLFNNSRSHFVNLVRTKKFPEGNPLYAERSKLGWGPRSTPYSPQRVPKLYPNLAPLPLSNDTAAKNLDPFTKVFSGMADWILKLIFMLPDSFTVIQQDHTDWLASYLFTLGDNDAYPDRLRDFLFCNATRGYYHPVDNPSGTYIITCLVTRFFLSPFKLVGFHRDLEHEDIPWQRNCSVHVPLHEPTPCLTTYPKCSDLLPVPVQHSGDALLFYLRRGWPAFFNLLTAPYFVYLRMMPLLALSLDHASTYDLNDPTAEACCAYHFAGLPLVAILFIALLIIITLIFFTLLTSGIMILFHIYLFIRGKSWVSFVEMDEEFDERTKKAAKQAAREASRETAKQIKKDGGVRQEQETPSERATFPWASRGRMWVSSWFSPRKRAGYLPLPSEAVEIDDFSVPRSDLNRLRPVRRDALPPTLSKAKNV